MDKHLLPAVACAFACTLASHAFAQVGPDGIDWVTIGAVGNAPWQGNGTPGDRAIGRGGVDYEYKIGRFEVTTAQWVEFFNAAYDRNPTDRLPHLQPPTFWGARSTTPNTPGGRRWTVPAGNEMMPTGNISWRMAAMYANWLCNDKSSDRSAFLNGAYDVSTFGYVGNIFTDQLVHNPGARYWIPTWDEWLKSAHFDPNKPNPDGTRGGWWQYSNGTDQPLIGGPPPSMGGNGQANFGWREGEIPGLSPFTVPLGAYGATSPWGLYDVSGGTSEWTEEVLRGNGPDLYRAYDGTQWDSIQGSSRADRVGSLAGAEFPSVPWLDLGFRIASVPSTGVLIVVLGMSRVVLRRRRLTNELACLRCPVRSTCALHDPVATDRSNDSRDGS